jgi:putative ABC transport system ATP-binding protein
MIRLDNVTKAFPSPGGAELRALDGVSLGVDPGEFVAVTGPSGSGKSTLLFAMGGLTSPTSGDVFLGETRVYDLDREARAALRRNEIGFVFQTFNLVPYLTCQENVILPALLAGRPRAAAEQKAAALLEQLGLSARRHHRPAQLSVGERQRVGIGRAIVNSPRLLLADEPTGNLDPATAESVMDLLCELNAAGQTIVMVTHDLRLAGRTGRVVRLRAGQVDQDHAPAQAVAS